LTATKTYAPTHLVYVAVVEHAHPTQGKLFVKVQNGYELDEIHNVSAQSPSNGQTIIYNASTSLWEKANLTAGTAISVTNGAGSITVANTGVTSITGTTSQITASASTGGVTLSLPSTINVNTSGSAASLSSTLAIASGGTGQTTANAAFNALAPSQTSNSGKYLTTDGTNTSWSTITSSTTNAYAYTWFLR
jgi:hypothetical protein